MYFTACNVQAFNPAILMQFERQLVGSLLQNCFYQYFGSIDLYVRAMTQYLFGVIIFCSSLQRISYFRCLVYVPVL